MILANKSMKKILLISLYLCTIIFSGSFAQFKSKDLEIIFTDYNIRNENRTFLTLKFELTNNSLDTMYISRNKISIHVLKNKKEIYQNKPSMGLPYVRGSKIKFIKCEEKIIQENQKEILVTKFSEKLFEKKFGNLAIQYKDYIIDNVIKKNCLVILPKQSIEYETIFTSEKFDSSCEVSAIYDTKKPFGIYSSGNKIMEIYDIDK